MDIDTNELRSSLTPREDNSAIKSFQNTVSVACPACGDSFEDLIVCKHDLTSLDLSKRLDFCIGVDDGKAYIFTHE